MKKMAAIAVALALTILAGCGSSGSSSDTTNTQNLQENATSASEPTAESFCIDASPEVLAEIASVLKPGKTLMPGAKMVKARVVDDMAGENAYFVAAKIQGETGMGVWKVHDPADTANESGPRPASIPAAFSDKNAAMYTESGSFLNEVYKAYMAKPSALLASMCVK